MSSVLRHLLSLFHIQSRGIMLSPGTIAPPFEVKDHNGNTVRLSDFKGKRVVLWFFPKADTPG